MGESPDYERLTEMGLIRREISKSKRHVPIRALIERAGTAIQRLKPCFMMSPLSVAQFLAPGKIEFDLLIMDEASQLRPEECLGAIARAKQVIVVGDPKQLPPTSFFDRVTDERLDLAVRDPERSGEYCLGILGDGPIEAAFSCNDRECLRPYVLKLLGWNLHPISSLDWFKRREREIQRLRQRLTTEAAQ